MSEPLDPHGSSYATGRSTTRQCANRLCSRLTQPATHRQPVGDADEDVSSCAWPAVQKRSIYLTLHRVIDALVEAVRAASEMLRQWLVPSDATVADVAVGGTFLVERRGADGRRWLTRGVYREVVPHRRLAHTWRWEGSTVESLVTVEFEPESAGRTRLTLTHSRFAEDEVRDQHVQGWTGCIAKLEALWAG